MNDTLKEFATHLRCPITKAELRELSIDETEELNSRISNTELAYYDRTIVKRQVQSGFISLNGNFVYPVEEDIILMLPSLAIALQEQSTDNNPKGSLSEIKKSVQNFYDEVGWQKSEEGVFLDTVLFTDDKLVSKNYFHECHLRLNRYLKSGGKYIIDVASGPITYPEYLSYSSNFDTRICIDLSLLALKEAKTKLGDKAIYILADITNLPIKDNKIDSVISLHTIYHLPGEEQSEAFHEIHRVLQPGSSAVVIYTWNYSLFMDIAYIPVKFVKRVAQLSRKLLKIFTNYLSKKGSVPERDLNSSAPSLYFRPQSYKWFNEQIEKSFDVDIYVWSSLNVPFLSNYIHNWLLGEKILALIYWLEEKFPYIAGRFGQYPIFIIKK